MGSALIQGGGEQVLRAVTGVRVWSFSLFDEWFAGAWAAVPVGSASARGATEVFERSAE